MAASDSHSEYEMNSGASLQRKSFSDMQPCFWIIHGPHSAFQTSTGFSVSDGSILMWMRRMIDMGVLPGVMTDDGTITHNVLVRQQGQNQRFYRRCFSQSYRVSLSQCFRA